MRDMGSPLPSSTARQPLAHTTRKKQIKTYRVRAYHEGCGGELVGTERGLTLVGAEQPSPWTAPWKHRCKKCGATGMIMGVNYPALAYEER